MKTIYDAFTKESTDIHRSAQSGDFDKLLVVELALLQTTLMDAPKPGSYCEATLKKCGEMLDAKGGMMAMQYAYYRLIAMGIRAARVSVLQGLWDGIGEWRA